MGDRRVRLLNVETALLLIAAFLLGILLVMGLGLGRDS